MIVICHNTPLILFANHTRNTAFWFALSFSFMPLVMIFAAQADPFWKITFTIMSQPYVALSFFFTVSTVALILFAYERVSFLVGWKKRLLYDLQMKIAKEAEKAKADKDNSLKSN